MIYFNESLDNCLSSLIESSYLEDSICYKNLDSSVYVCPDNPTYLSKEKTVIISKPDYPLEKLKILKSNGCKIISRISISSLKELGITELYPYILRPNFLIMWNGMCLDYKDFNKEVSIETNILGSGKFNADSGVLYFPKIFNLPKECLIDSEGNLTSIGYSIQQVGVNVITNTPFIDLDVLKTKKMLFKRD